MTRHIPDDRRFMTHEVRAIDDARYRGKVEAKPTITICFCEKTVVARGTYRIAECPRHCEERGRERTVEARPFERREGF